MLRSSTGRTRLALLPLLALLGALIATLLPASSASAAPPAKAPGRAIEGFAPYQPQTTCSPTAKPGTVALRTIVLAAYGGTGDYGIIRDCSLGGRSEHKEGRAWDWKASAGNPTQVAQVNDMLRWLFATDRYGNTFAQTRRLGIMYVIWNHRIWNASSHTWKAYTGADPHTSHVHFSLGWAGALKRTSYWTGVVSGPVAAPAAPKAPAPAPTAPRPTAPKPPVVAPRPTTPQPLTTTAVLNVGAASAKGVTTTFLLVAGHRYLLTSTGYYRYGPGALLADAECSVHPADGSWQRSTQWEDDGSWSGPRGHLDLQVGGEPTRWVTADGERCDATGHSYATVVEPSTTGPLALKVVDDAYSDNGGGLRVTVAPLGGGFHR